IVQERVTPMLWTT
nr:immunoglobulin heavy chain junction region [Mus musculus]